MMPATAQSGEVARGDRAGVSVLGRVEVTHPLRDAIAGPARQKLVAMIGAPAELPPGNHCLPANGLRGFPGR